MNRIRPLAAALAALFAAATIAQAAEPAPRHHRLEVTLDPATHSIEVVDRITLPEAVESVEFLLLDGLEVEAAAGALERLEGRGTGIYDGEAAVDLARYRARVDGNALELRYHGVIDFSLSDPREEYTRGFRETAGYIGADGVYLAAGTFWVPYFGSGLITFDLSVSQPEGWHVISQGEGTSRGDDGRARWNTGAPMEEVHLVGGPLIRYRDTAGAVEALVYLREQDEGLARSYLTATAQYVEMYRGLIGRYPYGKFALVENFWETGYGMPSFTLLGSQVIRFPFILASSYPHEILHNWWGNSVFVDYERGNWCEGLTAYMADHLIQEQRGKGWEYRRNTLQKYRNYVQASRDFPLVEFTNRHSAATEAVGYGKSLMGFHMIRRRLGDEKFVRALSGVYRKFNGKRASFDDLQAAFEEESEEDLGWLFEPWLLRAGAPSLSLSAEAAVSGDDWTLSGVLSQAHDSPEWTMDVPLAVVTDAGTEMHSVRLEGRDTSFELELAARPRLVQADPLFDLFRLLDPREVPPSIGQLFGAPEVLAVLPSAEGAEQVARYRRLMEGWQADSHAIEIKLDREVESLPGDRPVWVLGVDNIHRPQTDLKLEGSSVSVYGDRYAAAGHSWVDILRHPADPALAVGWLVVQPPEAFPGMGRKLPHYGKYSYLAFAGDEPSNVAKGQKDVVDSPLRVDLATGEPAPAMELEARMALAELPPVFSEAKLREHVTWLADPAREGRGVGTQGLDAAAEYIAERFKQAGLKPAGDGGSYFQAFTVEGPDGPTEVRNVIGSLSGSDPAMNGQSSILIAHYDHLGFGWPDVREGFQGQIHPGADDNASGVAVMLEVATAMASEGGGARTMLFVASAAEEAGKLGAEHFVEHMPAGLQRDKILGAVNIDSVGRLFDGKLSVLATDTAYEWQHIFRGVSYVTGVESKNVPGLFDASDQGSFISRGVPAVQLFTQPHDDYHRPGDTADKIDYAGLVKVATFLKETAAYLVSRPEPMKVTIPGVETAGAEEAPARPRGGRRVSFGALPDFGFPGPGVKFQNVTAGSPAEKAGFEPGDVLLSVDGKEIAGLRAFSDLLKTLAPGQTVQAVLQRGEQRLEKQVTVQAR
ncbi:hypothetical protein ABI59_21550 [Acidobacteria bacterium Mor1]|nr:hypothetical protein ABI59_21550 [Acidobacteria bacterium Mor1]